MTNPPKQGIATARRALVLCRDTPGISEERLGRILTFFGVPWQAIGVSDASLTASPDEPYAVLGGVETLAGALDRPEAAVLLHRASALFGYGSDDPAATAAALGTLTGDEWTPRRVRGQVRVAIAADRPEITGPLSSLDASILAAAGDRVLVPAYARRVAPIMSIDDGCAFAEVAVGGVPMFVAAAPAIFDIDTPVASNYYDVKSHFLAAVPLVMFLTSTFRGVIWRPHELGACLIIDDPLLKGRYGFCDFRRLRDQMREHWFTTNIAFIPWNWRRTSRRASEFFRRESSLFSVSVHGCDHIAAEFGAASPEVIDKRARLAQTRMRKHRARTRIKHDPIMVFPQGVFSASCPGVLKRNGFVAAVNTEVSPVGAADSKTLVRDVWDTAILKYGSFPIYTRRYQHHGIENFAFDLLLGKPCFIVAHHEEFRDGGAALVGLIDRVRGLNCAIQWRSPREVIRRAYRVREVDGTTAVRMFGTEMLLTNTEERPRQFSVTKAEDEPLVIARVSQNAHPVGCVPTAGGVQFQCTVPPRSEAMIKVRYLDNRVDRPTPSSMRYELSVAARRILSEFRDEYVLRFARA